MPRGRGRATPIGGLPDCRATGAPADEMMLPRSWSSRFRLSHKVGVRALCRSPHLPFARLVPPILSGNSAFAHTFLTIPSHTGPYKAWKRPSRRISR